MLPFLTEDCGNASSIHSFGRKAAAAIEEARVAIASLLGAEDPDEIVFTSGATESNNWVAQRAGIQAVSPFEHSSMLESAGAAGAGILENEGYWIAPFETDAPVAVMHVNNETGAIITAPSGELVHRDLTQTVGKLTLPQEPFATASFSAHKIYGPKGVGGLWIRGMGTVDAPLLYGGEHERGLRAGTLNVPGIVGFGEAARISLGEQERDYMHAQDLRSVVLEELRASVDWHENGHTNQSPFILSVSFLNLEGQTLVEEIDVRGFAISSGAACSSGSTDPSHVLTALGLENEWMRGTIRISFGRTNTRESARDLGLAIVETVESVRKLRLKS
jgi:cysteine desulfurase